MAMLSSFVLSGFSDWRLVLAAGLALLAAVGCQAAGDAAAGPYVYPPPIKGDQVDDYHGRKVEDPYRWLEDADGWRTSAWVQAQQRTTSGYLESMPWRDGLRARLKELWNYERIGMPAKKGGRYFFSRNDGLQNQSVLMVADTLGGPSRPLIDPNTLSADGTASLGVTSISPDGNLLAYAISKSGSDWREFRVRDVRTGKDLPDQIHWAKFTGASWTRDSKGFFYSAYDAPAPGSELQSANYFQKLYYHRLGLPQSEDTLVYERKDHKDWGFGGEATEDGKYVIITMRQGTIPKNRVYYLEIGEDGVQDVAAGRVKPLLEEFDAHYDFLGNAGPLFYFQTDWQSPRGSVIVIDIRTPGRAAWKRIVPEAPETLEQVTMVGGRLFGQYLKDAQSLVRMFGLDGAALGEVKLPGIGTVGGFGGDQKENETFYSYQSFTTPATVYRYDVASGQSTIFAQPKVKFDPDRFETKQVFYKSKDGARVPMFITHRKGLKLDGDNPVMLYGYGGFNISLQPTFSVSRLVWMEMGGVYAQPSLRGGGEYGKEWHDAGIKLKKQNVFDDFIAAAEYLIAEKYTRPGRLAISGGSNGGLLVGACMTQRPELFGAALPAVGVMDMLRFDKFTIGWAWMSDYGSPANPEEFTALYAYSPLHNLRPGTRYPSTMVTTADHDDRVVPAHSFKFAARLQECHAGSNPVLIRIETRAGHGAGKPTDKIIAEVADVYGFLIRELGMKPPGR